MAEVCWRCRNLITLVWWAPEEMWDATYDGHCLLCPECFTDLAYERGIEIGWQPVVRSVFDEAVEAGTHLAIERWRALKGGARAEIEALVDRRRCGAIGGPREDAEHGD